MLTSSASSHTNSQRKRPEAIPWRFLTLLAGAGAMVWRAPSLIFEPRLWAEEGTRYFPYAYLRAGSPDWYEALFQVQRGYFAFWPNGAATVAANFLPLEHAPLATTLLALAVQIAAVVVLLWTDAALWQTPSAKLAGVLVLLFVPLSGEIWLNTINSQFVFAVITFLILHAEVGPGRRRQAPRYILLLLGGLTGSVSCLLAPLFIYKALAERSRDRIIQAAILGVCALIQAAVLFGAALDRSASVSTRWVWIEWQTLVAIVWTQSLGFVLFGLENVREFAALITAARASDGLAFYFVSSLFLLAELGLLVLVSWPLKVRERVTLIGSYAILLIVSVLGSLGDDKLLLIQPGVGQRYFYAPNTILMLSVVGSIQAVTHHGVRAKRQWKWMAIALTMLLALSLFWGGVQYKATTMVGDDWPQWRQQVQIWRENSEHSIEIWPPGWKMRLDTPGGQAATAH